MAIAVQYSTVVTLSSATVNTVYTVPTSYTRDLVVTNSGAATIFVTLNPTSTTATSTASFQIPAGGSVVLTQCQAPGGAVLGACVGGATSSQVSVGLGSVVSVI